MAKQKILVTGASGMLGSHILRLLNELPQFEVHSVGRNNSAGISNFWSCDLTNLSHFRLTLQSIQPSYVIHCAANVNVNQCEIDRDSVYKLHVEAPAVISDFSLAKGIYISTDSVFDGLRGDYRPSDDKNPLNYYALTKSLGEEAFLKTKNSIVIRTNIVGYSRPFKNSLFEWGYKSLQSGQTTPGFGNIWFNPLYVKTLAHIIINHVLIGDTQSGIYHFGSSTYISKFDFLKLLASTFGFDTTLIYSTEANNEIGGISRPLNTTLNTKETEGKLGLVFPSIENELVAISNDLKNERI